MTRSCDPDREGDLKVAALDEWLYDLKKTVNDLKTTVEAQKELIDLANKTIDKLTTEITTLKENPVAQIPKTNWAKSLFSNKSDPTMSIIMASVARETKKKDHIENNIIISGIKISQNEQEDDNNHEDEDKVNEILNIINIQRDSIQSQKRIKIKKKTRATDTTAEKVDWVDSEMIRIEFKENETKITALKNAKNLRGNEQAKDCYINPELTESERSIEKQLRDERNKLNAALKYGTGRRTWGVDRNGNKYYWGIRGNQLKQIKFSTQQ
jgi:hypothetical protein